MAKIPAFDPIDYLVDRAFPFARHFPNALLNLDNPNASGTEAFREQRDHAERFRHELGSKTPLEIAELVKAQKLRDNDALAAKLVKEAAARFFNLPTANANFDHYCKAAYWTLDECIALSFGKNPKLVNWASVKPYLSVSPFALSYERLRDLIERAKWAKQLFEPVLPSIFLSWAIKAGVPLSEELLKRSVDNGISLVGWQELFEKQKLITDQISKNYDEFAVTSQKTIDELSAQIARLSELSLDNKSAAVAIEKTVPAATRERESMLKLLVGMAIKGYRFDPRLPRNSATKDIQTDLEILGLSMDDGTILKYLKEGSGLIDTDALTPLDRKPNSPKR